MKKNAIILPLADLSHTYLQTNTLKINPRHLRLLQRQAKSQEVRESVNSHRWVIYTQQNAYYYRDSNSHSTQASSNVLQWLCQDDLRGWDKFLHALDQVQDWIQRGLGDTSEHLGTDFSHHFVWASQMWSLKKNLWGPKRAVPHRPREKHPSETESGVSTLPRQHEQNQFNQDGHLLANDLHQTVSTRQLPPIIPTTPCVDFLEG